MATKVKDINFEEVIEAEIIEPKEVSLQVAYTAASLTANFDALRAEIEKKVAPYRDMQLANMDLKEAKACRADLNKMSTELNDKRKDIKRIYNAPLVEFEARIKELDALITAPAVAIAVQINAYEAAQKDAKEAELKAYYENECGVEWLALPLCDGDEPIIPFSKVLDQKWLNASMNIQKAKSELSAVIERIVDDHNTLEAAKVNNFEQVEAYFYRTLSLSDALKEAARLDAEYTRIAALKAEQDAFREQKSQQEPEKPVENPLPIVSEPEPVQESVLEVEEAFPYRIEITCTERQLETIIEYFKSNNIHGNIYQGGTK